MYARLFACIAIANFQGKLKKKSYVFRTPSNIYFAMCKKSRIIPQSIAPVNKKK
jgi:hypothetical protein